MGLMNKINNGALRVTDPNKILNAMNADWAIVSHDYQTPLFDRIYTSRLIDTSIKQLCINSANEKYNHELAGDIQKEFRVTQTDVVSKVENELRIHISRILNQHVKSINTDDQLWVNFQQKQEFNPRHAHEGMFSFVFYASIPESIREEHLKSPSTNTKSRGLIEFSAERTNGSLLFNPSEDTIFIFESSHVHQVYPFYSDETRISVAGNIHGWE
jgi:hypothetical protein